MRTRFNLDLTDLTRFTMLIHGNNAVGKTSLLGDMLLEERKNGAVAFINIAGEDGSLSIRNLGLGEIGENVDTLDDLKSALADFRRAGLSAIAVDGGKWLGRACIRHVCGERPPSVGKGSDDWQKIHTEFESVIASLRHVAPIVLMASTSDRSMDQVSGELTLTPDLPGRQAAGVGGMFDFVFVMAARPTGPNKVRRWLMTAPAGNTLIRTRLPRPLPHEIEIPENGGGWRRVKEAIQKALEKPQRG